MSSKDSYFRLTYTAATGIGNGTNPEVAIQLPTATTSGALWELTTLIYRYDGGSSQNTLISVGEATGFAPKDASSIFESAVFTNSNTFFAVDLNNSAPLIVAPDSNDKVYLHFTYTGASASSTDNTFTVKATFKRLKGTNATKSV